jgi:hypothetical protein
VSNSTIILVPRSAVKTDLVTETKQLVYMPLATRNNYGVVKIGSGFVVDSDGKINFDDWLVPIKQIAKNGQLIYPDNNKLVDIIMTKSDVGLSEVDNTSDVNKPVSTAQKAYVDAVRNALNVHINDFNNPHRVNQTQVGLGNVDNTSDENKPLSAAQRIEFAKKQNITDDSLTTSSKTVSGAINEVNKKFDKYATLKYVDDLYGSVSIGRTSSYVFETEQDFFDWLRGTFTRQDGVIPSKLNIGDVILIKEKNVPDYWVDSKSSPMTIDDFSEYEVKLKLEDYVTNDELAFVTERLDVVEPIVTSNAQMISRALKTPISAPSTVKLVAVDTSNSQDMITIGENLILENGVLSAVGGGSGGSGVSNYNYLTNKPQINGIVLIGNQTPNSLGLIGNTDYPTADVAGVVRRTEGAAGGIDISTTRPGTMMISRATNKIIEDRTPNDYIDSGVMDANRCKPICSANIDYAVKRVLLDDKLNGFVYEGVDYSWTNDEKAQVRKFLGATNLNTHANYGVQNNATGLVMLVKATDDEITNRSTAYKPIVPTNLDHAIVQGLINNSITLDDTQKSAIQTWLGLGGIDESVLPQVIRVPAGV